MATAFVWHERYMWHDTRSGAAFVSAGGYVEPDLHAENPTTKRRLRNLLDATGLLDQLVPIVPRPATEEEIQRLHTPEYVRRVKELSDSNGGEAGEATPFGPGSYEIALLAAGGCLEAVDAVVAGDVQNGYALVRPPGHHAEPDQGRGFCIFGNTALAAMHAREVHALERVAVVDWDVHHGNGTQKAFWTDPSVLTISVHQDNLYPAGSGALDERGEGRGAGLNINVPLPPGTGVEAYVATFERIVAPALRAFRPELVLVASGLDASALDPLGRQLLTSDAYRDLTRLVMGLADELCDDRILLIHEGGYSNAYVPFCGLAIIEELSGISTGVEDPFLETFSPLPHQRMQPHQEAVIAAAERNLKAIAA